MRLVLLLALLLLPAACAPSLPRVFPGGSITRSAIAEPAYLPLNLVSGWRFDPERWIDDGGMRWLEAFTAALRLPAQPSVSSKKKHRRRTRAPSKSDDASSGESAVGYGLAQASAATVDVTPPTLSITSPAADQILSGVTRISASATDAVGVRGVAISIEGADPYAFEDTRSPYELILDTRTIPNGQQVIRIKT